MFKLEEHQNDEAFINYIASIKTPLENSVNGLKADIAKLKEKTRLIEGIDIEALKNAKIELDALKLEKQKGETDLERANRIAKEQHEQELKTLKESLDMLKNQNRVLIVDDAIKNEMLSLNVDNVLLPAAINLVKPLVSVVVENGVEIAKIGDKTLKQYINDWSTTEIGKRFIVAKHNSGAGTLGGTTQTEGEMIKFFKKGTKDYNITEQLKIKRSNPELYKKLISLD